MGLSVSVLNCYKDFREACDTRKTERDQAFKKQPLYKRVAYVACEALFWGGLAVAAFSLMIGSLFSPSFLLYGAVGTVALLVGIQCRKYFETLSPMEVNLVRDVKQLNLDGEIPSSTILKAIRENSLTNDTTLFTAKEEKRTKQIKQLRVTTLLLESIQLLAENNMELAKSRAEALAHLKPEDKPTIELAQKLIEPNKALQEKVKQALEGHTFKIADLDQIYKIALEK